MVDSAVSQVDEVLQSVSLERQARQFPVDNESTVRTFSAANANEEARQGESEEALWVTQEVVLRGHWS